MMNSLRKTSKSIFSIQRKFCLGTRSRRQKLRSQRRWRLPWRCIPVGGGDQDSCYMLLVMCQCQKMKKCKQKHHSSSQICSGWWVHQDIYSIVYYSCDAKTTRNSTYAPYQKIIIIVKFLFPA
mmetsp:Transcript_1212/g.2320  ORF Transcript_1212/g.2320 Transcript_1212/m.2320 type:complete len:123 (-) Transcript_1212:812-1180(-)